jgi:integrase
VRGHRPHDRERVRLAGPRLITGLRRGEILALRWQDVDLNKGTLAVRQSLEQTRGSA